MFGRLMLLMTYIKERNASESTCLYGAGRGNMGTRGGNCLIKCLIKCHEYEVHTNNHSSMHFKAFMVANVTSQTDLPGKLNKKFPLSVRACMVPRGDNPSLIHISIPYYGLF